MHQVIYNYLFFSFIQLVNCHYTTCDDADEQNDVTLKHTFIELCRFRLTLSLFSGLIKPKMRPVKWEKSCIICAKKFGSFFKVWCSWWQKKLLRVVQYSRVLFFLKVVSKCARVEGVVFFLKIA